MLHYLKAVELDLEYEWIVGEDIPNSKVVWRIILSRVPIVGLDQEGFVVYKVMFGYFATQT